MLCVEASPPRSKQLVAILAHRLLSIPVLLASLCNDVYVICMTGSVVWFTVAAKAFHVHCQVLVGQ